jgi:acetate kinase
MNDKDEKKIAWGIIERIGLEDVYYKRQIINCIEKKETVNIKNHTEAVELLIKDLLHKKKGIISNINEIFVVGHRVVNGGNKFSKSVLVTKNVKKNLKDCFSIAPLHNFANYMGILAVEKILPGIPSVLVFDTVFHKTIPDYAYMYALPYELYKKDHIRKYGFHGISHNYVSQKAAEMFDKPLNKLNLITAHLGNGSSITAIKKGKVLDTSMGFTPLQGLVMGTRCGDIDPAVIIYLLDKYSQYRNNITLLNDLLNKKSGLLGISGISCDMRDIMQAIKNKNTKAILAFKMFIYSIKKYICAYYGILNGIDGLIFTGGIGENSANVRELICKNLDSLNIKINSKSNKNYSGVAKFVSPKNSIVKLLVIPTNEELLIARESKNVIVSN